MSPSFGTPYEADVTVLEASTPFTISPFMKVSLSVDTSGTPVCLVQPPSVVVFKVYDRRFTPGLRRYNQGKLLTYGIEASHINYMAAGKAPEGLEAMDEEQDKNYERGNEDDPPELL